MTHKGFRKCFLHSLGNVRTMRAATEGNSGLIYTYLQLERHERASSLVPQVLAYEPTNHNAPSLFPLLENEPSLLI